MQTITRSVMSTTADNLRQVQPFDELHDQDGHAVDLAGVVGQDDVGMGQPADGPHLACEAGHGLRVGPASAGEDLQRHHAIELGVQGLVNPAHAAAAQLLQHLVFAQRLRHRGRPCLRA